MLKRPQPFIGLLFFCVLAGVGPSCAGELHGRVIDRGTLHASGRATGIPGVKVEAYYGNGNGNNVNGGNGGNSAKQRIATVTTDARGAYRIRKVDAEHITVVFRAAGFYPAPASRRFALSDADTAARDIYLDRAPAKGGFPSGAYYQGLAKGFLAMTNQKAFYREVEDSVFTLGAAFLEGDSSLDYRGAALELLWGSCLASSRPYEAKAALAQALGPLLDSLGREALLGMRPFLETDMRGLVLFGKTLRIALKNPKRMPAPRDAKRMGIPPTIAVSMAADFLEKAALRKQAKEKFSSRWSLVWGANLSAGQDGKLSSFAVKTHLDRMVEAKPESPAVHYLRGLALMSAKENSAAAASFAKANRLRGGMFAAARYREAMAYSQLGRDQDALACLQGLRDAPEIIWKAKAYRGLALLAEKRGKPSEAASNLWKSIKLVPDGETSYKLLALSVSLSEHAEAEQLLEALALKNPGDPRVLFWQGRYAEMNQQPGVAEDHFRKAYQASARPEYAEALGRLAAGREEWLAAIAVLEPIKSALAPDGRERYAESLFQLGRAKDAAREYAVVYAAMPKGTILGRYVEALLQCGRVEEARKLAATFEDPGDKHARMAMARVYLRLGDIPRSREALEALREKVENDPDLHFLLGIGYFQEGSYSKARKEFDLALRYRADYLEAVYYAGLSLMRSGEQEAARNFFNELVGRVSPEWKSKGLMGVGLSFAAQQKPEAAENYYQRSLGVVETAEVRALLALSLRRPGGSNAAAWEAHARRAYAMDPENAKAIAAMGEVLLLRADKSEAMRLYRDGLTKNPGACDLLAGLAKAQYLHGQFTESRATSASALARCPVEAETYYYAAVTSDRLQNRREAQGYFKAYCKAGGDKGMLPEAYR